MTHKDRVTVIEQRLTIRKARERDALKARDSFEELEAIIVEDIDWLLAKVAEQEKELRELQRRMGRISELRPKWRNEARETTNTPACDGVKQATLLKCADDLMELTR